MSVCHIVEGYFGGNFWLEETKSAGYDQVGCPQGGLEQYVNNKPLRGRRKRKVSALDDLSGEQWG